MLLNELNETDRKRFNQFVMDQSSGSFLQSWEWGQWQEGQGRAVCRFFLTDGNKVSASLQLVRMPAGLGKHYLYAPYGPVAGPEFNLEHTKELLRCLRERFPAAVFVRLEPQAPLAGLPELAQKTVNIQPGRTLVVDLGQTREQILEGMHPKTRYNIRIAQKHGVTVQDEFVLNIGRGFYFRPALELIVATAQRQKYVGHPLSYYEKLADHFAVQNHNGGVRVHIYKALHENELLASALMVDFGKTRTYLFGGSSLVRRNVMAPYLLHFQAMIDAKNSGFTAYDFDGLETSAGRQADFARFKKGFGGKEVLYAGAYDMVNKGVWYTIYRLLRTVNRALRPFKTIWQ